MNKKASTPLIDRIIDLEQITRSGPTLRVVSDNMRSLLACVAMVSGATLLYSSNYCPIITKPSAVLIGAWSFIYAAFAAWQFMYLVFIALSYVLIFWKGPERAKSLYEWLRYPMGITSVLAMSAVLIHVYLSVAKLVFSN